VVGAPSAVHSAVVDHGELMTPVAAEFVDGGRHDEVYDKPQCYAKDNRAAFNRMQW